MWTLIVRGALAMMRIFFSVNGRSPYLRNKTQSSVRDSNLAAKTQFHGQNPNFAVEIQKKPITETAAVENPKKEMN